MLEHSHIVYDAFISYSYADSAWVHEQLLPQLESAGLRICIETRDFAIGVPSLINIERAIEQSRHTLLILTEAWVDSQWTLFEALLTQTTDPVGRQQKLLPLLLQSYQPPLRIAMLSYVDLTDPRQHAKQIQRVIATLQGQTPASDLSPTLQHLLPDKVLTKPERNRRAMLRKVRSIWIDDVLNNSLYKEVLIAVDLVQRSAAVIRPLDLLIHRFDRCDQPLPPETRVLDVYDQQQGALLILGMPGAGKTTLLLELARDLLSRAEHDHQHPIPVVFPLSTWVEERRSLQEWLIDELNKRYDVPRLLAERWVSTEQILPLLDGLDEVAAHHRDTCVAAINTYRQEHGLNPLVVCSRIADYDTLATRLHLQNAIVAQPLTRIQMCSYLHMVGVPATPDDTSPLWDILDTPLMLNIAALTYAGQPLDSLNIAPATAQSQLFAAYINRMFHRIRSDAPFTEAQARRYLIYLAFQMKQQNQTTLYLEHMQLDWLPAIQRGFVRWIYGLLTALFLGLVAALAIGTISGMVVGIVSGVAIGMVTGLAFGPFQVSSKIEPVESLHWSWPALRSALPLALLVGLVVGLVSWEVSGLDVGLGFGLGFLLDIGLLGGLSGRELDLKMLPNQGIRRSARSARLVGLGYGLIAAFVYTLVVGLIYTCLYGPGRGLVEGVLFGIAYGLVKGIVFGFLYGGRAYLQHYLLRLLLIGNRSLPHQFISFLDYATQHIFLRRVGGGYMFIHRLLLEHFAAQYQGPEGTAALHDDQPRPA